MILEVDTSSAVPPYEQLRQQVTALVQGGVLAKGDRLPAIRQLANDLGLAGGTVARAYRELEADGVVSTHGRHGTIVAELPRHLDSAPPPLLAAARRFTADAIDLGASLDDAISAIRAAYASGSPT